MTVAETIQIKVVHLPLKGQEEVLDAVQEIEMRYVEDSTNGLNGESPDPFDLLAEIQIDGPPDLAARHDFYAHGKVEA